MKIPFIVLVSLILGFGLFYAYDRYNELKTENLKLSEAIGSRQEAIDSQTADPVVQEIAVHSDEVMEEQKQEMASVTGTLGYPSNGIPPLIVYAFKVGEPGKYASIKTSQNQATFTIEDIETGTYTFVAYPQDTDQLAGGYTKAVPCGLLASCTDHSLIEVEVKAGANTGIEIKDWYAPEGTFPKKP